MMRDVTRHPLHGAMTISAVRYALGRMTYIVADTCRYVRDVWPVLDARARAVIQRDVTEALSDGSLGMASATRQWRMLAEWIDCQEPMSGGTGLSHRGDPDTSRRAAEDNKPRRGTQRHKVLLALVIRGPMTAEEVTAALSMKVSASGSSAAKRLSELTRHGYVARTDTERRTTQGSKANVFDITDKGREALRITSATKENQ